MLRDSTRLDKKIFQRHEQDEDGMHIHALGKAQVQSTNGALRTLIHHWDGIYDVKRHVICILTRKCYLYGFGYRSTVQGKAMKCDSNLVNMGNRVKLLAFEGSFENTFPSTIQL